MRNDNNDSRCGKGLNGNNYFERKLRAEALRQLAAGDTFKAKVSPLKAA